MERLPLDLDELVEHWTVLDEEKDLGLARRPCALAPADFTREG
jgi:hypothetical protein